VPARNEAVRSLPISATHPHYVRLCVFVPSRALPYILMLKHIGYFCLEQNQMKHEAVHVS